VERNVHAQKLAPCLAGCHRDSRPDSIHRTVRGRGTDCPSGQGEKNDNSADSTIDVKGNNYTITGNTAYNAFLDTFQTHDVYDNNGCGNIFSKNKLTVTKAAGYGINVTSQGSCSANPNKVGASNTSTGGIGLTKIPLTPGL
jgi:hypothetical protein